MNNFDKIIGYEAGHAVLHLLSGRTIGSLAIGKCGKYGLGVGMCCLSKVGLQSAYQESENSVKALPAGKASVKIQFGEIDLGTMKDLQNAMDEIEDTMEVLAANGFEFLYLKTPYSNAQSIRQIDKIKKKVRIIEEFYNRTKIIYYRINRSLMHWHTRCSKKRFCCTMKLTK